MMFNKLKYLMLMAILLPFQNAAAGSGKAILPHWSGAPIGAVNQSTYLWLSNITSHTLIVSVTFYQMDGTVAPTSALTFSNFIASNTELAAGTSGYVQIRTSSINWGYAVVTWQNIGTDNDALGLIGEGENNEAPTGYFWSNTIALNNWQPF